MAEIPYVISSAPKNYQNAVAVNTSVVVEFNTDLDTRYVEENMYMHDNKGQKVNGRFGCRRQKLTFIPLDPLDPGTTYTLVLVGDSDLENNKTEGLRSILNVPMRGNTSIVFTTESEELILPPMGISPIDQSIVKVAPTFEWTRPDAALRFEFQLSSSNTFDILLFPKKDDHFIFESNIDPEVEWKDGIYYWRVRSISEDSRKSEWSETYQFNLSTLIKGSISEDDGFDPDDSFEDEFSTIEQIDTLPKHLAINVPVTTKTLYFRIIGTVDMNDIFPESFTLTGSHITGEDLEESHGDVEGSISVVSDIDGTSYIIFTPIILTGEDDIIVDEGLLPDDPATGSEI